MDGLSPEVMARVEADRKERIALLADIWRDELTHKDWLFDGSPIRGQVMIDRYNNLDWSAAWIDLGPSVAGNPGPYWHVPLKDGDTVHRLYPKVLQSKWGMLILHACYGAQAKAVGQNVLGCDKERT